MEQNAKKWFDFGPGISLSLRQSGGRYLVRLELANKPAPAIAERAFAARWAVIQSGQDGQPAVYEHMNDVRSLSDVATRLEAFFDKGRITSAIRETSRTPVDIAPPSRSAPDVSEAVLSVFSADAPLPLMQHIARSIDHAYAVMGARMAAAKQLPFEGDAFGVFDRLVGRVEPVRAAEIWGTVLLAVSMSTPGWQEKLDFLMEADAGGREPDIEADGSIKRLVAAIANEVGIVNGTGLASIDLAAALRGRLVEAAGERINYRAYDGASFQPKGAPDLGSNTFSVQQGVSLDLATDAKARLTLALSAAAKGFGIGRDRLFGEDSVKFFFAPDMGRAGLADRGSATLYRAGDDVKLEYRGNTPVTVEALKRDKAGNVIGKEEITTNRNQWDVQKSDKAKVAEAVASAFIDSKVKDPAQREALKAAVGARMAEREKANKVPAVPVYDKAAPAKSQQPERTGPVVERNAERTR